MSELFEKSTPGTPSKGKEAETDTLINRYKKLYYRYKTILDLCNKIYFEVESGADRETIVNLMKDKFQIGEQIKNETQAISESPIPSGEAVNSQMVKEAKEIIEAIQVLLDELWKKEEVLLKLFRKRNIKL